MLLLTLMLLLPSAGLRLEATDEPHTGIAVYPGATLEPRKKDDSPAATLAFAIGDTALRFSVAKYRSSDKVPDVVAFYREELARYGRVIECGPGEHEGECKDRSGDEDATVLQAGPERDRRIVAVMERDGASHLVLVRLRKR